MKPITLYTNPQSRGRIIRWMLEELKVSQHAQQLGTPYPISVKRILHAVQELK